VEAPAYPLASLTGLNFASVRVAVPVEALEAFYSDVSSDMFGHHLRSYGAELRQRVAAVPPLGTPDVDMLAGIARALDEPVRGEWRFYLTLAIRP
jgi:hypothetical protein